MKDILQMIESSQQTFSKRQKLIAKYILENYDKAAFITAARMGQVIGVSESTVVRFAYTMGFEGYPEFQKQLQEVIRSKLTSVQRIALTRDIDKNDVGHTVMKSDMQNIRASMELFDYAAFSRAVEMILGAKTVYILGMRSSTLLATFLGYYLDFVLGNVRTVVAGMHEIADQLVRVSASDVLIGISFPRYSKRTVEGIEYARAKNCKIIAITDAHTAPVARLADECLIARSDMASFADSLVAPLSLINALIVSIGQKKQEDASDKLVQLESIWDKQEVYLDKN